MAMRAATMRQAMKCGGATTLLSRAFNGRFIARRHGSIMRDIRSKRRGNLPKTTDQWDAKVASASKEDVATNLPSPTVDDVALERSKNLYSAISSEDRVAFERLWHNPFYTKLPTLIADEITLERSRKLYSAIGNGDRVAFDRLWHEYHADVTGRSTDQTTDTNSSDAATATDTGAGHPSPPDASNATDTTPGNPSPPEPAVPVKSKWDLVEPFEKLILVFPRAHDYYNRHFRERASLFGAFIGGIYGFLVLDQTNTREDHSWLTNLSIGLAGMNAGVYIGFAAVWTFPNGLALYGAIVCLYNYWRSRPLHDRN